MPSPYAPLATFLANQPLETTTVTLSLTEIEQVLGRPLPAGAWTRGWWQSTKDKGRPRPWLVAGWRVAEASMRQVPPLVTFARLPTDSTAELTAAPQGFLGDNARERRRGDRRMGD
jgi:hypothetical protein